MNNIVDSLSTYLNRISDPEFMKTESIESGIEDPIIKHFRSVNLSNNYTIEALPDYIIVGSDFTRVKAYSIAYSGKEVGKGISIAQITNMNLSSGYSVSVDYSGSFRCNVFFLNKCIETFKHVSSNEHDIRRAVINLKPVCTHILSVAYPKLGEKYINVAGGVVAVAVARRIKLPVTPSILSEAYHCTIPLAEAIIEKYDLRANSFVDIPWMF